jgi:hypothetical protein
MTATTHDEQRPMTDLEPDPLLAAAKAGVETAFATLVERHHRELHVHRYRMLGSFDEAEDLVRETAIAEITTFGSDLFPAFGLAETL